MTIRILHRLSLQQNAPIGLMQAITDRRSVRSYRPEPVARETIMKVLRAAVQAPSAMHEEPWHFAIIQDRQLLDELSRDARASADQVRRGHLDEFFQQDANIFHGAGTLILICAKPDNPFVEADCWLAAENLMLAAYAMGLGTCIIGLAVRTLNQDIWKGEIGIPAEMVVHVPIILGVPTGPQVAPQRKAPRVIAWR